MNYISSRRRCGVSLLSFHNVPVHLFKASCHYNFYHIIFPTSWGRPCFFISGGSVYTRFSSNLLSPILSLDDHIRATVLFISIIIFVILMIFLISRTDHIWNATPPPEIHFKNFKYIPFTFFLPLPCFTPVCDHTSNCSFMYRLFRFPRNDRCPEGWIWLTNSTFSYPCIIVNIFYIAPVVWEGNLKFGITMNCISICKHWCDAFWLQLETWTTTN